MIDVIDKELNLMLNWINIRLYIFFRKKNLVIFFYEIHKKITDHTNNYVKKSVNILKDITVCDCQENNIHIFYMRANKNATKMCHVLICTVAYVG